MDVYNYNYIIYNYIIIIGACRPSTHSLLQLIWKSFEYFTLLVRTIILKRTCHLDFVKVDFHLQLQFNLPRFHLCTLTFVVPICPCFIKVIGLTSRVTGYPFPQLLTVTLYFMG